MVSVEESDGKDDSAGRIDLVGVVRNRRALVVLAVIVLVAIVIIASSIPSSRDGGGGPGGPYAGYMEDYTYDYSREPATDGYLDEGDTDTYDFIDAVFPDVGEGEAFFLDSFWIWLEFSDEGPAYQGRLGFENAPDTFEARLFDQEGRFELVDTVQNSPDGHGDIALEWHTDGPYFCVGDPDALGEVDVEVVWEWDFAIEVTLVECGDHSSPYVPITEQDTGNYYFLHFGASGYYHEPGYADHDVQ